jgi:hypothetical protein
MSSTASTCRRRTSTSTCGARFLRRCVCHSEPSSGLACASCRSCFVCC